MKRIFFWLLLSLVLSTFFVFTSSVFAQSAEGGSGELWEPYNEQPVPEPPSDPVPVERFTSAEAASDTGTFVSAIKDDAQNNGQTLETGTGYYAYTQNGYVYREDADGRGFTQLGQNYQTGALIDPNTGKAVDYAKGYDWGPEGAVSPGGGVSPGNGGGESWNFVPESNDYRKDANGTYYSQADDGTYRNGAGQIYTGYEAGGASDQPSFTALGSTSGGQVIDDQGRQVVTNDQGQSGFIDNNGQFQKYDLQYGNDFFDTKGGQLAMTSSGSFVDVKFDSDGKPYTLGEDGKTKWTFDNNGQMVATDENGKKMTLNEKGEAVYESGGGAPAGASAMSPKGAGYSSSGLKTSSGQQLFKGSNGQLYQQSGNQMVPYTGQTMAGGGGGFLSSLFGGGTGGYTSGVGGIGSTLGGLGAGIGSALGGLFGGGSTPYAGGMGSGYSSGMAGLSSGMGGLGSSGYGGGAGMALPTNIGLPSGTIQGVLTSFLYWLLGIFGLLALISFIVSGIMYFTAMGNKEEAEKAKKHMQWSIIGVVVGLAGMIIITSITTLFKGGIYF